MSPTTSSVTQNLFYAQNQFIDIVNELNNKGMKIIK